MRETIEKLKAKNEILTKKDSHDTDSERTKENREKKQNKQKHKDDKDSEYDDGNSTLDSIKSENRTKHNKLFNKNSNLDALTLATEQTLKDINKWLDDTPKFPEFSSGSNSPSHYSTVEEIDADIKKSDKMLNKRDNITNKDIKKRGFTRDPAKFFKRREVQRTIDRLQPGKSKGNLLSNVQSSNKSDDIFPLGHLSKIKDSKNSLIVKTDENAPKLSLGTVLDSFGKHKFVDDQKKEDVISEIKNEIKTEESQPATKSETVQILDKEEKIEDKSKTKTEVAGVE